MCGERREGDRAKKHENGSLKPLRDILLPSKPKTRFWIGQAESFASKLKEFPPQIKVLG